MATKEIAFEQFATALEVTRGTLITPPTHTLNLKGIITPKEGIWYPPDALGSLADQGRSEVTRQHGEWSASGGADVRTLPLLFNRILAAVTTPTTPTSGVLTRLWTFIRTITADTIKSATDYWGNPNDVAEQGAYSMVDTFAFKSDASSNAGATVDLKGTCQWPSMLTSPPAFPALVLGPLLVSSKMQVWIDVASAIGTTAVVGRVVSFEFNIPTGVTYKYIAVGPTGAVTYDHIGRKATHPMAKIKMEVPDLTQYNNFVNADTVKLRVRQNGPAIETVTGPLTYYNYVEFDIYGKFGAFAWGDLEGSNRTIEMEVQGELDGTLGSDCRVAVQNTRTTL